MIKGVFKEVQDHPKWNELKAKLSRLTNQRGETSTDPNSDVI